MNKEISFRGKRIDNGEWVYGYYRQYRDRHQIGHNVADGDFYYFKWFDVDPSTVGQLVRKGSEPRFDLYEGDILTDDWGYRYVIEWDNDDTVYRAKDVITAELETLHGKWAIGTEYDNPELLQAF